MRKYMAALASAAVIAIGGGAAQGASGGVSTGHKFANCHSFSCVNKKLTAIHNTQVRIAGAIAHEQGVLSCLRAVPETDYGDPNGSFGYYFDNGDGYGPFLTTGLDLTYQGDSPSFFGVADICNGKTGGAGSLPKTTPKRTAAVHR